MGDTDIENELKAMRAQLEALNQRVEHGDGRGERRTLGGLDAQAKKLADALDLPELSSQVGSMLRTLGKELQESKPGPLVAAFLAGVVVGRATSR